MRRRQLNLRFLAGLILATVLLGAGFYGLHAVQVKRNASAFRELAQQAQAKGDQARALDYLERYLLYRPQDVAAMTQYAQMLEPAPGAAGDPRPAIAMYRRILVREPGNDETRRRCAGLELRGYEIFKSLAQTDPRFRDTAQALLTGGLDNLLTLLAPQAEDGKLEDSTPDKLKAALEKAPKDEHAKWQLGQLHEGLNKPNLALLDYEAARRDDPALIEAYVDAARLLRSKAKSWRAGDLELLSDYSAADTDPQKQATDPQKQAQQLADRIMDAMIAQRPAGDEARTIRAYLERARYRQQFGLPGAQQDIAQAQRLDAQQQKQKAPDQAKSNPDVLLLASEIELQASPPNWVKARQLLEEGVRAYPQDSRMYESFYRLEIRANQPGQAERWLRRGIDALPETDPARLTLQIYLADRLIQAGQLKPAEDLLKQVDDKNQVLSLYGRWNSAFLKAHLQFNQAVLDLSRGRTAEATKTLEGVRKDVEQLTNDLIQRPDESEPIRDLTKRGFVLLGQCHDRLAAANPTEAGAHLQSAYDSYRRAAGILTSNVQLDVEARLRVALGLLNQGKDGEARAEFTKLLRLPELRRQAGGQAQIYQLMAQTLIGRAVQQTVAGPNRPTLNSALAQADTALAQAAAELPGTVDPAPLRAQAWLNTVQALAATGQLPRAQEVVQEAEKRLLPDQPLLLAQCLELIGQHGRADQLYRQSLAAKPDDRGTLILATAHAVRNRRIDEAKTHLRRLIELVQGDPQRAKELIQYKQLLAGLTAAGGNQQQVLEALQILGGADAAKPDAAAPELVRSQAKLLAAQPIRPRRREAIRLLEGLSARQSAQPGDLLLLARLYLTDGDWPKARAVWRDRLLTTQETNPALLAEYVATLLRQKAVDEAETYLARLEKIEPDSARTLEVQARVLAARNQLPEAVKKLQAFAQADPSRLAVTANLLEVLGAKADAEALFRTLPERFPDDPRALLALVGFLGRQGRSQEGLDLLNDRFWDESPDVASEACVALLYSSSALSQEQFDQAVARIEKAIAKHPERIGLKFHLANVRSLQGQNKEAEAIYRAVIAQNHAIAAPLNNLAWLLALQGEARLDEAATLIKQAIDLDGETPALLDTRALIALTRGRVTDAVHDLEEALAVDPSPDKYFHLARAYQAAGRRDDAAESLRKADELGLTTGRLHPLERPLYEQLKGELARH